VPDSAELDRLLGPPRVAGRRVSFERPPWPDPLPAWASELLAGGPHYRDSAGTPDRSREILQVATAFVRCRYALNDFRTALADPRNALGEKYREHDNPEVFIGAIWASAKACVEKGLPPATPESELIEFIHGVTHRPMPGRQGPYVRQFLLGVCVVARRSGTVAPIRLSERVLEETCGMSRKTVRRHLRIAIDAGWLIRIAPARGALAGLYELHVPHALICTPLAASSSISLGGRVSGVEISVPGEDAFTGLRPSVVELLNVLQAGFGRTVKELAEVTGRAEGTVRRALAEMAELRLAVPSGMEAGKARLWHRLERDHDDLATERGTTDASKHRAGRIASERLAYRRIREAQRARSLRRE
jgi:predicted transcriptional regulator